MEGVFLNILNMTISASWLILAVIIIRALLTKAPKGFRYVLWALVAIRLLCPFSIESAFSLIPSWNLVVWDNLLSSGAGDSAAGDSVAGDSISGDSMSGDFISGDSISGDAISGNLSSGNENVGDAVVGDDTIVGGNSSVGGDAAIGGDTTIGGNSSVGGNATIGENISAGSNESNSNMEPMQAVVIGATIVWAVGIFAMLVYLVVSYLKLRNQVKTSVRVQEKVWINDDIRSPFILGIISPRIYLPSHIEKEQMRYIVAHEKEHLRCLDYVWKPLGFVILSIHWFNPLVWLSYVLMCRDIELACDERVIRKMDASEKKNYLETLLACSSPRHFVLAYPVAFGEIGIKERIKRVIHYKKASAGVVGIATWACIVIVICFMTNPLPERVAGGEDDSVTYKERFHWLLDGGASADKTIEDILDLFIAQTKEMYQYAPEKVIYETTADVTQDGLADLIQTVHYSSNYEFDLKNGVDCVYVRVFAGVGGGSYESKACYISDTYAIPHATNGEMVLVKKAGKDYLMYSNMYEHQGGAYYEYRVFTVGGEYVNIVEEDKISFATTPYMLQWLFSSHREEVIPAFKEKMTPWIENGIILFALDVEEDVYVSTNETECVASKFYDNIWARSDAEAIADFEQYVGNEEWKVYLYHYGDGTEKKWVEEQLESDFSEWYTDYSGQKLYRIERHEGNAECTCSIANNCDVIYYDAENGETVQQVLKKMVESMIVARMKASDTRSYTITDYAIEEQHVMQIAENMWMIRGLNGYYSLEGVDQVTMNSILDSVNEVREDGLVPFVEQGSETDFWYILMEEDGVYRLQRWDNMK